MTTFPARCRLEGSRGSPRPKWILCEAVPASQGLVYVVPCQDFPGGALLSPSDVHFLGSREGLARPRPGAPEQAPLLLSSLPTDARERAARKEKILSSARARRAEPDELADLAQSVFQDRPERILPPTAAVPPGLAPGGAPPQVPVASILRYSSAPAVSGRAVRARAVRRDLALTAARSLGLAPESLAPLEETIRLAFTGPASLDF